MTDLDQLLTETFADLGRRAPHDPDLAGAVRRRARRQGAVAASVAGVLAVAGLSAVLTAGGPGPATPAAPAPAQAGCTAPSQGVLPEWARYGFSDPRPRVPHVLGRDGRIVAILFGPLIAPTAPPDRSNKILWAAREVGPGSLEIEARRLGGDEVVRRVVEGGPGPSIVDLPVAGCWQLDLRWGEYTDTLFLTYG